MYFNLDLIFKLPLKTLLAIRPQGLAGISGSRSVELSQERSGFDILLLNKIGSQSLRSY